MEFIKTLNKDFSGRKGGDGTLIIADGYLRVRLNDRNIAMSEMGIIKDGVGVVVKKTKTPRNSPLFVVRKYSEDDIPVNLQGEKYRFVIPAKKISDTEYVFMFNNAKMLNKK